MKAEDLFNPQLVQIFDKKTGQRLDYGVPEDPEDCHEDPVIDLKDIFESQTSLNL